MIQEHLEENTEFSGMTAHEIERKIRSMEFRTYVRKKFLEAEEMLLKKHEDYGPTNISRSPGGPLNGLRVRMHDKLARINHLMDSGVPPRNESLRDSFLDLANYSIIAMMVIDEEWPNE